MTVLRRLVLAASIVLSGLLALTAGGSAAGLPTAAMGPGGKGGGGFLPAGNYHFTTLRADFNLFSSDPSQPTINLYVSRNTNVSRPEGGPPTTTVETQVFFFISSYTVNGGGCVLLASPSDFNIGADLKAAALKTTIDSTTPTCGPPISLQLPITLDVKWTGVGPIATGHDNNHFVCVKYTEATETADTSNNANATASLSPALGGSFSTTQAGLGFRDQRIAAEGVADVNCGGGIGGKGAGPGALAAGKYEFTRTEANYSLFPSDPSQPQIGITVSRNTSALNPQGGPASSTAETDLFIFVNSGTVAGVGCFVLANPADFTISSNLSTAALHTTLSSQTPTCNGFPSTLSPLPPTVDVTWTGAGPISETRDEGHSKCLDYTVQSSGLQTINNGGTATATLSGLPGSFTTVGGMGSNKTRIETRGVPQQSCIVRF
jgi:hypothetical protein